MDHYIQWLLIGPELLKITQHARYVPIRPLCDKFQARES
jgi:hypothetical protein